MLFSTSTTDEVKTPLKYLFCFRPEVSGVAEFKVNVQRDLIGVKSYIIR
jgi:hypothetical protein